MESQYPELKIRILAVNEWGQEQGNAAATPGRDIPLLQDEDANNDNQSDAWTNWEVEWRDLVFVDGRMERVGSFNLTTYDLANPENYAATKDILIRMAQNKPFWQNESNHLDVNGDGQVTPIEDVLRLINELNNRTISDVEGRLPLPIQPHRPAPYLDVNGDGFLSPAHDILPIINYLNGLSVGEGEGEMPLGLPATFTSDSLVNTGMSVWLSPNDAQPTFLVAPFQLADSSVYQALEPPTADELTLSESVELKDDRFNYACVVNFEENQELLDDSHHDGALKCLPRGHLLDLALLELLSE